MSNVLFVTSEFEPQISSGVNRISFFKNYLESQGHNIFVLTTSAEAQGVKVDDKIESAKRVFRAYALSCFHRRLLSSRRAPIYQKLTNFGKYATWKHFAIAKGKKLVKTGEIDFIFTSFPDFVSLDVATALSLESGKKLVVDFRDPPFWIYETIEQFTKKLKLSQEVVSKAIEISDTVVTATDQSACGIAEYYNVALPEVICNGYDLDLMNSLGDVEGNSCFVITHIGSFYSEGRDIVRVLKSLVNSVKCVDKRVLLRLIGDKPEQKVLEFIQREISNFDVSIEAPLTMKKALLEAKSSDALLLIQGSRFDRQIPTKLYEYLALSKPIWAVVGENGATRKLLDEYNTNVVYSNYDDFNSILEGNRSLFSISPKEIDTQELSRQAQASKLLPLFR